MVLILLCEKPDSAMRIANALAESGLKKKTSKYGVDYYEFLRNSKKHIAVAAVGHLFNLKQKRKGWDYPIFNLEWVPSFQARKISAFSEKYYKTIQEIAKSGSEYISACDYDNEGSVIARNILKFICNVSDAKRMKFSTLAKPDLIYSYEHIMPHLDFENIEAGLARHFLDYYYGINASRALTLAIKKSSKRFSLLTAGRVQGPTLVLLAEKEKEIARFVPKPYWQLELILLIDGKAVVALYEKDKLWDKKLAEKIFSSCKGKPAIISDVVKKRYKQSPPAPFNVTSLQTEAYRLFGYSPRQTLNIAQNLYTGAAISYPRTSSEKLPPQINYKEILAALSKIKKYEKLCKTILGLKELKPTEGKRTDPAHECFPDHTKISLNNHSQITITDLIKDVKWKVNPKTASFYSECNKEIRVFAFDDTNKKIVSSRITKFLKIPTQNRFLLRLKTQNKDLDLTPNHEVYCLTDNGFGFRQANTLKAGDYLTVRNVDNENIEERNKQRKIALKLYKRGITLMQISKKINVPRTTISGWVHYKKGSREQHLPNSLIENFEDFNEEISSDIKLIRIDRIEQIKAPEFVYDFEIEPVHTFLANGFIVHNCIHPTVEPPMKKLSSEEQKIYDLICRRFFSVFAKEAVRESMQITILVNGYKFLTTSRHTIEKGWMEFYGPYAKLDEVVFPELKKGEKLDVKKLDLLSKETSPPPRYSQASIIKKMEQLGLGTRATRAAILQTLYDRDYIFDKSIKVTKLGLKVADTLKKYVPDFVDEKLTRKFERDLEKIQQNKIKKEKILSKAKRIVTKICSEFKQNEDKIGKELGKSIVETQTQKSILGPCPNCGKNLKILFSPRTKKVFCGCSGYPKCKYGMPLPQKARIQPTGKICDKCNTPIVYVYRKGKRPFRMCIDINCSTKSGWVNKSKQNGKSRKK